MKTTTALTATMTAQKLYRLVCDRCERFDDETRLCSTCGHLMIDGWCIESGIDYYCTEDCLKSEMSWDEFIELYDDGNGDSYWTEWGDLDGKLLELAEAMADSGIDWRSEAEVPEKLVKQALEAIEDYEARLNLVPFKVQLYGVFNTQSYLHVTRELSLEELEAFRYYVANVTQDASLQAVEAFKREYVGHFTNPYTLGMHVIRKRIEAGELTEDEAGELQPRQIAQDIYCGIADGYHNLNGYIFKEA